MMRHADKTVTVYHKEWSEEIASDVYRGSVISGVSFFTRISTAVSTDGLAHACEGVLRIPIEKYPNGLALNNGDLVCQGALQTDGLRPPDMAELCPYVFTIVGITRNTSGHGSHVKVVCK